MPRTVNVEVHKVRRDAFLDVARRLIVTKGYEQMSIQDVLDELETSREPSTTTSNPSRISSTAWSNVSPTKRW